MQPATWLPETRRALTATAISAVVMLAVALPRSDIDVYLTQTIENAVVLMAAYLICYLALTVYAFSRTPRHDISEWVATSGRGTWMQRYVLGTTPGPGLAIFVGLAALLVSVLWLPQTELAEATLPSSVRAVLGVVAIVAAWLVVLVSFAVAYWADDLRDGEPILSFPGSPKPEWGDYLYFSMSVMATFGTTDVEVLQTAARRTVVIHGGLAFVFNTVILGAVVSALLG